MGAIGTTMKLAKKYVPYLVNELQDWKQSIEEVEKYIKVIEGGRREIVAQMSTNKCEFVWREANSA